MNYMIKEPCNQDWNKMLPIDGGRFCDQCQKKVHDLSNGEILKDAGRNICGRIKVVKPRKISFTNFLKKQSPVRFFALMLVMLFSNKIKAQLLKMEFLNMGVSKLNSDTANKEMIVNGNVRDSISREIIPFATVTFYNREKKNIGNLLSDMDGNFTFHFLQEHVKDTSLSFRIEYKGYQPLEITDMPLTKDKISLGIKIDSLKLVDRKEYVIMAGAVYEAAPMLSGTPAYQDDESFNLFPGNNTISEQNFKHLPSKNLNDVISMFPGAFNK